MAAIVQRADIDAIVRAFPPREERPQLEIPRHWSNIRLTDPDTIIALVLRKPTTGDLARTIVSYGPERVLDVMRRLHEDGEIGEHHAAQLDIWLEPVMQGVADAARQLPAA